MNTLFRFIIISFIVTAVLAVVSFAIPSTVNVEITNSITYFLNFINYLRPLFRDSTDTLFICIKILANFLTGYAFFKIILWITRKISN